MARLSEDEAFPEAGQGGEVREAERHLALRFELAHLRTVDAPRLRAVALREFLERLRQVEGAVDTQTVTVSWQAPATWEQIVATLEEIEYAPATA